MINGSVSPPWSWGTKMKELALERFPELSTALYVTS
jgi:hypothetical protein